MAQSAVRVDTSDLTRGVAQLSRGLSKAGRPEAMRVASGVVSQLRTTCPVDTGALRRTIMRTPIENGAQVHYGGTLRYAVFVEGRTHIVRKALTGVEEKYRKELEATAAKQIGKL